MTELRGREPVKMKCFKKVHMKTVKTSRYARLAVTKR